MSEQIRPPRENLFRAVRPGLEVRADDDETPVMRGHFAVFNEWTEIDSIFEGRFRERFAPGAFDKTMKENREGMRVLFQHGRDPQIGDKPLGPIRDLHEDNKGAAYEVDLLDAPYVREEVLPALEAGLYGASMRFRVIREQVERPEDATRDNPERLAERTVQEAQVMEFGPVTFPAYEGATAGVRSLTDEFVFERLVSDKDSLSRLIEFLPKEVREEVTSASEAETEQEAPEEAGAERPSPRPKVRTSYLYGLEKPREEKKAWRL